MGMERSVVLKYDDGMVGYVAPIKLRQAQEPREVTFTIACAGAESLCIAAPNCSIACRCIFVSSLTAAASSCWPVGYTFTQHSRLVDL